MLPGHDPKISIGSGGRTARWVACRNSSIYRCFRDYRTLILTGISHLKRMSLALEHCLFPMQIVNAKTKKSISVMYIVAMVTATNFAVIPESKRHEAIANPFEHYGFR